MKTKTTIACSLAVFALACGTTSSAEGPADDGGAGGSGGGGGGGGTGEVPLPETADHERLAGLVRSLAAPELGGRLTGTASGERAEAFVRDFLEAQGLEVIAQEVALPVPELSAPTALEVLGDGGAVVDSFRYLEEYREVRWSGEGRVEGGLFFVGHGVVEEAVDAYAGLDVAGKVVAILAISPRLDGVDPRLAARLDRKIAAARARGAVGVVFVANGAYGGASQARGVEMEMIAGDGGYGFDPAVRAADVPVVFLHAAATPRLLGHAADELAAAAPFDAGKRVRLELHATARQGTCRNLIGVLRGEGPEAQDVVILGAHYDHLGHGADGAVFPGASDNATGAAVVLEAAATFAGTGRRPRLTAVFALFCGEELGLYGSNAYVADPVFPLEKTRLMVQFDYLGNRGPPTIGNYDGGRLVSFFVADAFQHPTLPLRQVDWQGACASDDCGFLAHDVRAYRFLAEGDHHHRVTDTFENLSLPIVERVADIAVKGLGVVAW